MAPVRTCEAQYQPLLEIRDREGLARLGLMTNQVWRDDPKRLLIVLARYKFVAKMLSGQRRVLEVGCADAFGSRIVRQQVGSLVAVDFDPVFIADARDRADLHWPVEYRVHDMVTGPVAGPFDSAYCVDVIEHIDVRDEDRFIANMARSLTPHGVLLVGSPSLESQVYASPQSKEGHVNCKDERGLRELLIRHFENVFMFSMNDEVVHTGFAPLAHYRFALCCSRKPEPQEGH
jgi:2-polyprenyl-3-methyl-5-hydroxy-6-metoxy-1,4-benzoquinol methylase